MDGQAGKVCRDHRDVLLLPLLVILLLVLAAVRERWNSHGVYRSPTSCCGTRRRGRPCTPAPGWPCNATTGCPCCSSSEYFLEVREQVRTEAGVVFISNRGTYVDSQGNRRVLPLRARTRRVCVLRVLLIVREHGQQRRVRIVVRRQRARRARRWCGDGSCAVAGWRVAVLNPL